MTLMKRIRASALVVLVATLCVFCIAGCGGAKAATYNGGSVSEDDVTTTIENMRTYYELQDDAAWAYFIVNREYDTGQNGNIQTAVQKAAEGAAKAAGQVEEEEPDGTLEDLREYVIEQIIRSELLQNEIDSRKIVIEDSDVDAYVDQQRQYVESRLMEGVFESVLQRQGYKDLDQYRDEVREQLKQLQLQNEVSTVTDDDGQEISGIAAWNHWFNGIYEDANVRINPGPDPLPYAVDLSLADSYVPESSESE